MTEQWWRRADRMRKAKGLRSEDLAERLDISYSAIRHKLTGRREATIEEIAQIARLLGISVGELVEGDVRFAATQVEIAVLEAVRRMDAHTQKTALALLSALIKSPDDDSSSPPK